METSAARAATALAATFYDDTLQILRRSGIPFLIGGTLAFSYYAKLPRDTKDMDVFVRPPDCPPVLDAFAKAGYRTEMSYPHWLGKIWHDRNFIDVIFSSGNGVARVDNLWF